MRAQARRAPATTGQSVCDASCSGTSLSDGGRCVRAQLATTESMAHDSRALLAMRLALAMACLLALPCAHATRKCGGAAILSDHRLTPLIVRVRAASWVVIRDSIVQPVGNTQVAVGNTINSAGQYSWSFWFMYTSASAGGWSNMFLNAGNISQRHPGVWHHETGYLHIVTATTAEWSWTYDTAPLGARRWYHVAFTLDNVLRRVYLDGVQIVSQTGTGNLLNSGGTFWISDPFWHPPAVNTRMSDLRFAPRVAAPSEIAALAANGIPIVFPSSSLVEGRVASAAAQVSTYTTASGYSW